jgi:hypothetical protein
VSPLQIVTSQGAASLDTVSGKKLER